MANITPSTGFLNYKVPKVEIDYFFNLGVVSRCLSAMWLQWED